jgi:hypothetical protein
MDFDWLLILGVVWFVVNLLTGTRRKTPPQQVPRQRPPTPTGPTLADATQREGSRLEIMLRQFERALEQAQQAGQPAGTSLPPEEEWEERESLEVEPEITSLEGEVHREARQRVDQDDEAEQIEVRRIQAAAARDTPRSKAEHAGFDKRIRQEPADHTATRGYTAKQLRDAVVWREVLGPPVSMRVEEGER